jgi:hypothetical protein
VPADGAHDGRLLRHQRRARTLGAYRATVLSQDCETVKKLHDRNQINDDTYSNLQYGLVQGLFKDMDDANYKRKKADK